MKLYIKYMVSIRCKTIVKAELDKLGLTYGVIDLGEVEVREELNDDQREKLKSALSSAGLVLMDDKKALLIEKIKSIIIEAIHYNEELPKQNFSVFLSERLGMDYTSMANLFSEVTGITIEKYIIIHKIDLVKELLLFDEINLTEIAYKLNYSSLSHLSYQFKKVTGLTPTFFKQLKQKRHTLLDQGYTDTE